MPMETPGEVAVVRPAYAIEEAYQMGHDEFTGVDADSADEVEFHHFTEMARWANVIAPKLRAMAGYGNRGRGSTYTQDREVAAIRAGCEEDTPAEADLIDAHYLYNELVDAYRMGALDAVEDTYDPDSAVHGAAV